MTRLDAIQDIILGRGIQTHHVGETTTYNVIIRRTFVYEGGKRVMVATMVFDDDRMGTLPRRGRHVLPIRLTWKQVLNHIRRNFPRTEAKADMKEVA